MHFSTNNTTQTMFVFKFIFSANYNSTPSANVFPSVNFWHVTVKVANDLDLLI